jgi:hypothetical protein
MTHHPNHWQSAHRFESERIGAVAIYCSDGRYGEQFDEFLHEALGLPRYDRLAIPGGAAALAGHFAAYREEEALIEQLRFLVVSHNLERVVLIAHRGCGFYVKKLHTSEEGLRHRQEEDLAKAAAAINARLPRLRVDAYFSGVDGDRVTIEPVALPAHA